MTNGQLELPIPRGRVRLEDARTRGRVRLDDAAPEAPVIDNGEPRTLGEEILADAVARYPDAHLSRTPWCTHEPPPAAGWWEVTDHETGTMLERWWFEPMMLTWLPTGPKSRSFVTYEFFRTRNAWRGLLLPHPDTYPTPPYANEDLVNRAFVAGLALRTTLTLVNCSSRERNRL